MEKSNIGAGLMLARQENKDKMRKTFKNEMGITLVTLIITIIIMLILVAVTVQVVINSNLLRTAQDARNRTETVYQEEGTKEDMTVGDKNYANIDDYIAGVEKLPEGAGERFDETDEYSDGTDTAVIPEGFTVSGIPSEQTIDGGLVIYLIQDKTDEQIKTMDLEDWEADENNNGCPDVRETYDQFVWIPVNNINDMYICQGKTATNGNCDLKVENGIAVCKNEKHSAIVDETVPEAEQINKNTLMAGYFNWNEIGGSSYSIYTSGSSFREPDTLSNYDGNSTYLGYLSSILEPGVKTEEKEYTSIEKFKEKLQEEYNEVVKSVYENQGFYVGRYETSGMAQSVTRFDVAVVAGTLPAVNVDWYHMYAQQRKYAENNELTVGSTMIQGAAYVQVLKFVYTKDYDVRKIGNVGHSTAQGAGSIYQTGGLNYNTKTDTMTDYKEYKDVSKNIYDLEGNVKAWTTEASGTTTRYSRGGYYGYIGSASSRRGELADNDSQLKRFTLSALHKIEYFT